MYFSTDIKQILRANSYMEKQMIRTDLAMEMVQERSIPGISMNTDEPAEGVQRVSVEVLDEQGEQAIGKKKGIYITLQSDSLVMGDVELDERFSKALADEIKRMGVDKLEGNVLVVGLGNRMVTPDALGPYVCDKVFVTRHIHEFMPTAIDERMGKVSAVSPGVLGITGVETVEIVEGVVSRIKPSLIIVIDSLASRSLDRVKTTLQIADTGIAPGAGVGNKRKALDEETLGVKVIAVGVPLVVYASTIAHDLIESKIDINNECKESIEKQLAGNNEDDMIVTPKDIDKVVTDLAKIIADGINLAVHNKLGLEEVKKYMY